MTSDRVWLTEVGPRDGLQNEQELVPLAAKIRLVNELARAGCPEVEVSAFVRPDRVPQLADAAAVFAGIDRKPGTVYSALVPNMRGYESAVAAGAQKIALFTSASESFAERNINASIAESLDRFAPVVSAAADAGLPVRVYVSCAVACPFEGEVAPTSVRRVVQSVRSLGPVEVDLADTIGAATPRHIEALIEQVACEVPPEELVMHLHDTNGAALACAEQAITLGVRRFDSSCGGLGGCPFAPGAPGNVSTSSLLALCERLGFETGIDAGLMAELSQWIRSILRLE